MAGLGDRAGQLEEPVPGDLGARGRAAVRSSFEQGALGLRWRALYRGGGAGAAAARQATRWAWTRLQVATDLLSHPLAPRAGRALEVGCGEGSLSRLLTRRGFQVLASDFSAAMLHEVAGRRPLPRGLMQADAEQLPIRAEGIDLLVCLGVLEYLADPAATLLEFQRVLRASGGLLISAASYLTPGYLWRYPWRRLTRRLAARSALPSGALAVRGYNPFKLDRQIVSAGFTRAAWRTHTFQAWGWTYWQTLDLPLLRGLGNDYVGLYLKRGGAAT